MLYSSAWRNKEGNILLTFTNIDKVAHQTTFTINPAEMGLDEHFTLYIDGVAQEGVPQSNYELAIDGCATKMFEFKKN